MADHLKASDGFKNHLREMLIEQAQNDPLFGRNYLKEDKNIDDCCAYVLNKVNKSKVNAYTEKEILGMAMHYYDEYEIEVPAMPRISRIVLPKPTSQQAPKNPERQIRSYTVKRE